MCPASIARNVPYVDLVNQWQLLACCRHGVAAKLAAPFKPKDADLFAVVQGFDDTYSAYADHQNRMERFWCLRWLQQEHRERAVASVIKGDLVRLDEIPLMMHVPGLGVHARGTQLLLEISNFDELMIEASCRVVQVLNAPSAAGAAAQAEADAGDEEIEDTSTAGAQNDASDDAADQAVDPEAQNDQAGHDAGDDAAQDAQVSGETSGTAADPATESAADGPPLAV